MAKKPKPTVAQQPRFTAFGPFPVFNLMVTTDVRRGQGAPRHSFVLHTEISLQNVTEANQLRVLLSSGKYADAHALLAGKTVVQRASKSARDALKLAITAS
ncbi:MAG: hypothetical protein HKN71_05375 [Gemmatimonadetes bacterium]|nr:hypothetical protein [Gemmatimonadota bacterium]